MEVQKAYDIWAHQYDTNRNKTRDLEAVSLRETLAKIHFKNCLEIGCGTGKNTEWLATKATLITAVDLSEEMLTKAKDKRIAGQIEFLQADVTEPWHFAKTLYDLVVFSLVLEHIENLDAVFEKMEAITKVGSNVYIGELHPFKQYSGSKARFETEHGQQIVTCFNHHISDFIQAAQKHGFQIEKVSEYFDDNDHSTLPRTLTLLFKKVDS